MVDALRQKCPNLVVECWIGIEEYSKPDQNALKELSKKLALRFLGIEKSVKKAHSLLAKNMIKRMQTTGSMNKKSFLSKSSNVSAELDKIVQLKTSSNLGIPSRVNN